jgi:acyl dehydratase
MCALKFGPSNRGAVMSEIRNRTIHGLQVGDVFTISRRFTEKDMMTFADVTRDYNAVHLDPRFSSAKNFKDRICHGLLVGSMLTEIGGQIGWLASAMNFRFKQPVYFGETITCRFCPCRRRLFQSGWRNCSRGRAKRDFTGCSRAPHLGYHGGRGRSDQ